MAEIPIVVGDGDKKVHEEIVNNGANSMPVPSHVTAPDGQDGWVWARKGHNAAYRACFIRAGSCGSATVSDQLTDTTGELDDFSFSVDVKLNLVVTRGCVIHGFL